MVALAGVRKSVFGIINKTNKNHRRKFLSGGRREALRIVPGKITFSCPLFLSSAK